MTVQKAKTEAKAESAPAAPKTVDLQVNQYTRFVYKGVLFEKGTKYTVSEEKAKVMLRETDERGVPFFGRYKAPARRIERYVEVVPPAVDLSTPEAEAELRDSQDPNRPRVIEIGDDSEIADLIGAAGDEIEAL
jgi:hypothetical protein